MTVDSTLIFESYKQHVVINEWSPFEQGSKLDWAYEALKFFEPTGILSIPDVVEATTNLIKTPTTWNSILFLLSLVAVVPVAKYAGKGLSKSMKVAAAAAAKGEDVTKLLPAITKEANELGDIVFKNLPEIEKFLVSKVKDGRTVGQIKGAISILRNSAVRAPIDAGGLAKVSETLAAKTVAKKPGILSKLGSAVKGSAKEFKELGKGAKRAVRLSRLGAISPFQKAWASVTGKEQNKGITDKLADTTTTPATSPFPAPTPEQQTQIDQQTGGELPQSSSSVMTPAGIVPQNIFQALGGSGERVSSSGERYGVVAPPNYGQGATPENPAGRETMTPPEYTMPDTFNADPASLFLNMFNSIINSQAGRVMQPAAPGQAVPAARPTPGAFSRYNQLAQRTAPTQTAAPAAQQQFAGTSPFQTPYGAFPNDKFAAAVNLLSQMAMR